LINAERLVCSPTQAAAEERGQKANAIDELALGAGKVQFVEEPVEVEEWR
jgi:hypothetical protein